MFRKPFFLFHILATIGLFVFVSVHAFTMDITHDEAYSFKLVHTWYFRAMVGTANTHWLNSFFMALFKSLFGNQPGVLRLHSIMAFPFFAHAIYRLAGYLKTTGSQLAFYCLVLFNPYILDFFSLARGYGMAFTFQAWTIILLIKALNNNEFDFRRWLHIFILNAFMLAANFSYLNTVLTIVLAYVIFCAATGKWHSWYSSKPKRTITLLFGLLIFFTMAELLFIRFYTHDLGYGGDQFMASVFDSVWHESLYLASYNSKTAWFSWCSLLLITAACLYFTADAIRRKQFTPGFTTAIVVAGILLLVLFFYWVLNTPYIAYRTALQWYVPGLLVICMAFNEWSAAIKIKPFIRNSTGIAVALLVAFHFSTTASTRYCMEWYFLVNSRQTLYDLYAQHPKRPQITTPMLGVYENYYSQIDHFSPVPAVLPEGRKEIAEDSLRKSLLQGDYTIIYFPATIDCLNKYHIPYTVIKTYEPNPNKLVRIGR